jgi:hypothetical protein
MSVERWRGRKAEWSFVAVALIALGCGSSGPGKDGGADASGRAGASGNAGASGGAGAAGGGAAGGASGVDAAVDAPSDFGSGGSAPDSSGDGSDAADIPVETVVELDASSDVRTDAATELGNPPTPIACGCLEVGARCTTGGLSCCGSVGCSSGICGGELCVANGLPVDAVKPCCSGNSRDGLCVGPDVCRPAGAACDGVLDCCAGFGCVNGRCSCVPSAGADAGTATNTAICGPANPCCGAYACSLQFGTCVTPPAPSITLNPDPACMPHGGLCDQAHKCCGGETCCNGFCGSRCMAAGEACDDVRKCCLGTCVDGTCALPTWTGGVVCNRASNDPCTAGVDNCCNGTCVNNRCHQEGHADNGVKCTFGAGCGDSLACVQGVCRLFSGCLPRGFQSSQEPQCCSGAWDIHTYICL